MRAINSQALRCRTAFAVCGAHRDPLGPFGHSPAARGPPRCAAVAKLEAAPPSALLCMLAGRPAALVYSTDH